MNSQDHIQAYVRGAYARASIHRHAVNGIPYGTIGLAQSLGREPTWFEVTLARQATINEGLRLQHAAEFAQALGIMVTFDETGRVFRCDADGRELQIGVAMAGQPGMRWP